MSRELPSLSFFRQPTSGIRISNPHSYSSTAGVIKNKSILNFPRISLEQCRYHFDVPIRTLHCLSNSEVKNVHKVYDNTVNTARNLTRPRSGQRWNWLYSQYRTFFLDVETELSRTMTLIPRWQGQRLSSTSKFQINWKNKTKSNTLVSSEFAHRKRKTVARMKS